jgi:hypothetical protein
VGGATKEYEGGGVVCTAVELLHHTRYRSRKRLRWFESKAFCQMGCYSSMSPRSLRLALLSRPLSSSESQSKTSNYTGARACDGRRAGVCGGGGGRTSGAGGSSGDPVYDKACVLLVRDDGDAPQTLLARELRNGSEKLGLLGGKKAATRLLKR